MYLLLKCLDAEDNHKDAHRILALRQQEVHMLATEVLHLHYKLMDAHVKAEYQLAVMTRQ